MSDGPVGMLTDTVGTLVGGAADFVTSNPAGMAIGALATGGMSGLLSGTAIGAGEAFAGAGLGSATGVFDTALSTIGSSMIDSAAGGGLASFLPGGGVADFGIGTLGNMARVGMNLYQGISGLTNSGPTGAQAQQMADPYSPYRQQAAGDLNKLIANPGSITSSAGYQAGLEAQMLGAQRQMAATGQSQSGLAGYQAAVSSGDYFNNQFNNQYNRLAQLAGANQSPSVGAVSSRQAEIDRATSKQSSMQYLNQAFTGMFGNQQQAPVNYAY